MAFLIILRAARLKCETLGCVEAAAHAALQDARATQSPDLLDLKRAWNWASYDVGVAVRQHAELMNHPCTYPYDYEGDRPDVRARA